jgi:DNA invertase Pin-like site-specific DNA recombinase
MKKTIIYIRTSTEDQEPQNQINSCERLSDNGYYLFQDKQSAFKDDKERDGFNQARKLIKSGSIRHFIAWDLDRIYRNRKKLKEFFQFCKVYQCSVHSVNQQWLEQLNNIPAPFNEIMHDLMLNLMGWLSEDESKKKSERVKLAVRKAKNGQTKSYKGNKWGRKPVHTNKANIVIKLKEEGMSYRNIAKETNLSLGKISQIISVHKSSVQN